MTTNSDPLDRYRRQSRFAPLGTEGQRCLMSARVLICGCGALGSAVADTLVRAGVGHVRIVDRDFVELDNLHRQLLFDEQDAAEQLPKAVAAAQKLSRINSNVQVEPRVADVCAANIRELAEAADVLIDGTDNFDTRYLLNDYAVESNTPWIFAGCVGTEGQTLAIVPGETPCLACILPEPPPATAIATCESAGVLAPIVHLMASLQSIEAIKLLSGNRQQLNPAMTIVDLWNNEIRSLSVSQGRSSACSVCGRREFAWLDGQRGASVTRLCGRNSVQISPAVASPIDLVLLADKLRKVGQVTANPFLVRLAVEDYLLTVFADGRTIVGGTDDATVARAVHAKYVGT